MARGGEASTAHTSDGVAYNVYNQPLDPNNNMPVTPTQLPWPGQSKPLSTERAVSTIPKGGTNGATWVFPSPQMFFNALKRKGKGDDVVEEDMEHIISVHNGACSCPELTHCGACPTPRGGVVSSTHAACATRAELDAALLVAAQTHVQG